MRTFRQLFDSLLTRAVATSALGLAGCGADTTGFTSPACGTSGLALTGINPAEPVTYAELRRRMKNDTTPASLVSSTGTKCGGAPDMAACTAAFDALAESGAFYETCLQICEQFTVKTTQGGTVRLIDTVGAWKAFLGAIDTEQEAALLAWSQGYSVACGQDKARGAVKKTATGFEVIGTKGIACGPNTSVKQYRVQVDPDGSTKELAEVVLEYGNPNCAIGRRPEGLCADTGRADSELGAFLAAVAHLEAASVPAFLRLGRELEALGAPRTLQDAALRAAAEEVVHAGLMGSAAQRYGAQPTTPAVGPAPARDAFALALDNAVEGCVRETYGAAVARVQADAAADPELAAAFGRIAQDEAAHAAFSWELHEWLWPQLDATQQLEVRKALAVAVATLEREVAEEPRAQAHAVAGMPTAAHAQALVAALEAELWRPAALV